MKAEQGGNHQAAPGGSGKAAQDEENQNGITGVEQNIGKVKAPRIKSPKAVVEHKRPKSQRVPVGSQPVSERPEQVRRRELKERVVGDVGRIIKLDEIAAQSGQERPENEPEQQQGKEENLPRLSFPNGL